ncbi:MAG: hypothetical protein QME66_03110 [Candidatus Eisenbacteria bacterium]|nr:hypothetical protein [Candidatus Eisenbacteria bacterium]
MKKIATILSILLVSAFLVHFSSGTRLAVTEKDSPAFSLALNAAVKTLEGVTSVATTGVRVAEAEGEVSWTYDQTTTCDGHSPTCDGKTPTCAQWYTCDDRYTCWSEPTCDGSWTCWNSTCNPSGVADNLTCDGITPTCDKGPNCNFTADGSYTCNGTPECTPNTCNGWPTCVFSNPRCAPSPTDKTTWGNLKARFK